MLFKLWKWRIEVKVRNMDVDNRIAFLAQNLIKEVVQSGRDIYSVPHLASFQIYVYQEDNGSSANISNILRGWNIPIGEVTCVKFEQEKSPCANMD